MAKERTYITTPPTFVRWANLTRPDTRFATTNDPRGTYSIEVLLDPNEQGHAATLAELEAFWTNEYAAFCRAEGKRQLVCHDRPWREDTDEDGIPTGLVTIRPKNKEYYTDRHGARVAVWIEQLDAKKKRIRVDIGNGSVCRVNFEIFAFYHANRFGCSLRLRAVQVLHLVAYGRDYGFGEEEGYVGAEYVPEEPALQPEPPPEDAQPAVSDDEWQDAMNDELPF